SSFPTTLFNGPSTRSLKPKSLKPILDIIQKASPYAENKVVHLTFIVQLGVNLIRRAPIHILTHFF
ncbi:MAG: hypothetical protein WAU36_08530, partial [Cyclobacteriaceae bacterium]